MSYEDIISFIVSPGDIGWLIIIKTLVIIFSLILLVLIIFFTFWKTSWLKVRILLDFFDFFNFRPYEIKKLAKQWAKILARLETGLESEYKLAVIEADSIFNDVLKKMGYSGETLGERLKKITSTLIPNTEEVWQAHKIRNNIVHDPDFRLSLDEAKKVITIYEKTLTDLGAL